MQCRHIGKHAVRVLFCGYVSVAVEPWPALWSKQRLLADCQPTPESQAGGGMAREALLTDAEMGLAIALEAILDKISCVGRP